MRRRIRGGAIVAAAALGVMTVLVTMLPGTTLETAAQPAAPTAVVERPGVVYGSALNASGARRKLRLDLFLPASGSGARRPAVVLAHGGGFRRGSRKDRRIRRVATALAQHGYVTASITYRLRRTRSSGPARTLRMVRSVAARHAQHDLQAAVRFLRRRATRLGVARTRIAALGSSAGGIAALRAAFNPDQPGHSGNRGYRSDVAAVVALWAASDPRMIERGAPPALMFHGRADTAVPFRLGRRTCRATRRRGNVCRGRWWPREGHAAWHRTDEIVATTIRFLDRRVR